MREYGVGGTVVCVGPVALVSHCYGFGSTLEVRVGFGGLGRAFAGDVMLTGRRAARLCCVSRNTKRI